MKFIYISITILLLSTATENRRNKKKHYNYKGRSTRNPYYRKICMNLDTTLRARRKSCFLRPDTGPCRADIIQWYFDVKQRRCYRFFWGGCQGNGNRFETEKDCSNNCYLNTTHQVREIPHFCSLSFDYGTCFGHYNRWAWDKWAKTCKRRMYSGCGGNQNNFESQRECLATCLMPPNNTMQRLNQHTTCVPFHDRGQLAKRGVTPVHKSHLGEKSEQGVGLRNSPRRLGAGANALDFFVYI
ncbi:hypothetical protein K1T71_000203 [Dendrolimus kikuchii]|uniref:Uncharacterized protein n=1 Tax=Dendrolimus kikuchii TaxID=765133 RepID=A0ACC1DIP6_9NEOP|nr:hypothetical protein K1T71_000203 [Dendrolimus kikuchii]